MNEPLGNKRRDRLYLLLVLAVALAVRFGYLASLEASPYYDVRYLKGTDNYDYFVAALQIAEGDWIGRGLFDLSPLYQYFLALIFLFTGGNLLVPRALQLGLGAVTAATAFWGGKRLGGGLAGLFGGLITALYGPLFFYEAAFLRDGLLALLYSGVVLSMIAARERPGFWRGAGTGFIFILSYLGRPNIAILVLILPWWLRRAWKSPAGEETAAGAKGKRGWVSRQRAAAMLCGAAVGLFSGMIPLMIRNRAAGVPVFSTTRRGALEFIAGNHPSVQAAGWDLSPEVIALEKECAGRLSCAVFTVLAVYREHPLELARRQIEKTALFFWGYELASNQSYYVEQRYVPFLRGPWLTWSWLIGGSVVGFWLSRRKWRQEFELFSSTILLCLGTVAFYVADRFRLPMVPMLAAFAGTGLAEILRRLAEKKWLAAALPAFLAGGLVLAAWPRLPDRLRPNDYANLVRYHVMRREDAKARAWWEEGKKRAEESIRRKGDAYSHYRLASLLFLGGRPLPQVLAEVEQAERLSRPKWLEPQLLELRRVVEIRERAGDPLVHGFRLQALPFSSAAGREKTLD